MIGSPLGLGYKNGYVKGYAARAEKGWWFHREGFRCQKKLKEKLRNSGIEGFRD